MEFLAQIIFKTKSHGTKTFKIMNKPKQIFSIATSTFVVAFLHFTCGAFAEDGHTSMFNAAWLKCVVSIEQLDSPTTSHPIGTGFILQSPQNHLILITAKHVVLNGDGTLNIQLGWRLNEKTNASDLISDQFDTSFLSGWFISSNADLACRFIGYANESDFLPIPTSLLLPQKNLEVGAHVLILGFPMGLRSERYTTAIARSGIVARSDNDELMLDAFVFPGNSGGPVVYSPWVKIGANLTSPLINDERIAGVVIDYIPYVDVAISPQTKRPRITFEENSGLSHAVPADKILELINRADFQALDQKLSHP
jgi:Trypsin-like peptidase domain